MMAKSKSERFCNPDSVRATVEDLLLDFGIRGLINMVADVIELHVNEKHKLPYDKSPGRNEKLKNDKVDLSDMMTAVANLREPNLY
jgi:hypothetical protein